MSPAALKHLLVRGAGAGLAGGVVFGAAMTQLGTLPSIALLIRAESALLGALMHMVIAAVIGMGFALLVRHQRPGAGESLFWGTGYGTFWWFLGPLTLMPLFLGEGVTWQVTQARAAFPSLLGHLLYGATTGLAYLLLQRRDHSLADLPSPRAGTILRGMLAGLVGAWLLAQALGAQGLPLAFADLQHGTASPLFWMEFLAIGLAVGSSFAMLYPRPTQRAGVSLVRGTMYGFLWWIILMLTFVPLLKGMGLNWSLAAARANFHTFPGFLLFGAATALGYRWLDGTVRLLFSDEVHTQPAHSTSAQGLRIALWGWTSGLVGGLLFTVVMAQLDILPLVAGLVGSSSPLTGFMVHLVIASFVGISFGMLFRSQSHDLGSALGWGMSYGFFWWLLGPLTLMPVLLGGVPQWTVAAAVDAFGSLVGHLAYGAGLGLTFRWLELRYNPWWLSRTEVQAEWVARLRRQMLTSSPALWVQMIVLALVIPVLLGR
jgi:hypothetical protein